MTIITLFSFLIANVGKEEFYNFSTSSKDELCLTATSELCPLIFNSYNSTSSCDELDSIVFYRLAFLIFNKVTIDSTEKELNFATKDDENFQKYVKILRGPNEDNLEMCDEKGMFFNDLAFFTRVVICNLLCIIANNKNIEINDYYHKIEDTINLKMNDSGLRIIQVFDRLNISMILSKMLRGNHHLKNLCIKTTDFLESEFEFNSFNTLNSKLFLFIVPMNILRLN
ncbi:uncharacterized protein VNE69_02186 [Vairimorpha necatrix]|uniref:Uncharacterized protein n=1 Tax=Vairimorpha necatrix TaxID=6039 RepID=A0AAX4J9P1_9MICR